MAAELRFGYGRDWLDEALAGARPADGAGRGRATGRAHAARARSTGPGGRRDRRDARPREPGRTPRRRARARRRRPRPPCRRGRRRAGPGIERNGPDRHRAGIGPGIGRGDPVVTQGDTGPFVPASTTKLLTTTAALAALGPDHTFTTRTVLAGRRLVLVGGGDPYLASRPTAPGQPAAYPPRADVASLADLTAEGLRERGVRTVSVGYDDGLFSGPAASPTWEPSTSPTRSSPPSPRCGSTAGAPRSGFGAGRGPVAVRRPGLRRRPAPGGHRRPRLRSPSDPRPAAPRRSPPSPAPRSTRSSSTSST